MSTAHQIVKNGMSLAAFFKRYPDDLAAEAQFEKWRWPSGPVCPHCGSTRVSVVKSRWPQAHRCRDCRRHFSFKTDTPMHDSKLGAQTWLLALFLIVANPKGRSSVQLAADLGITQKSAWHVSHRIRAALSEGALPGFDGRSRSTRPTSAARKPTSTQPRSATPDPARQASPRSWALGTIPPVRSQPHQSTR